MKMHSDSFPPKIYIDLEKSLFKGNAAAAMQNPLGKTPFILKKKQCKDF